MVLDTNILIDYLKGDEVVIETVRQWFADGIGLFISAVTYAEVLAFKGASETELQEMRQFLENFVLIPVDKAVAERIAAVRRENKIKFPDAAIIATALFTMSSLVTRDKRLHKMRNLTVISI
ncbi:MAG TPA: PIN domain-containing protein [Candidatus Paceibacterota bacterium]